MATKLKQISNWLSKDEIKHKVEKKKGVIIFGAGDEDITLAHIVKLHKEDTLIQWYMKVLDESDGEMDLDKHVNLKDNLHKDMILEYLLSLNYSYKLGSWEYDYRDGDLRFYMAFPLEDTEITEEQFDRMKHAMLISGREGAKGIKYITEHGELPDEQMDAKEMLRLLEEFIKRKEEVIDVEVA